MKLNKLRNYLFIAFIWFGFVYARVSYHLGGVVLIAMGYLFFVSFLFPGKLRFAASEKELVKAAAWFIMFCVVSVVLNELWGGAKNTNRLLLFDVSLDSFHIISLFPVCLAFMLMFRKHDNKNGYCIFVTCLLFYDILVTMGALLVNEDFARVLATGGISEDLLPYKLRGAMGFELTYSVALIIPLLFVYGYQKKKLFCCIVAGVAILYVYQCAFTLAMILMILNIGLALLFLIPQGAVRKALLFAVIVLGIVLLIDGQWIGKLLSRLSEFIYILPIKQRVKELANLFLFDDSTGESLNRLNLYLHDLSAIVRSPILGMTIIEPSYQNSGHSTIMDLWSSFGLIAVVPLVQTVRYMYRYCTEGVSQKVKGVAWATYVSFFVLATFNPVLAAPHILVTILWLVPMLVKSLAIDTLDKEHPQKDRLV